MYQFVNNVYVPFAKMISKFYGKLIHPYYAPMPILRTFRRLHGINVFFVEVTEIEVCIIYDKTFHFPPFFRM